VASFPRGAGKVRGHRGESYDEFTLVAEEGQYVIADEGVLLTPIHGCVHCSFRANYMDHQYKFTLIFVSSVKIFVLVDVPKKKTKNNTQNCKFLVDYLISLLPSLSYFLFG